MFCLCVQENLLQSVLPVYISMKMKLAILERLQDCKDKEDQQLLVKDNNFHSLYVKRHENVRYYHQKYTYIYMSTIHTICKGVVFLGCKGPQLPLIKGPLWALFSFIAVVNRCWMIVHSTDLSL